jgi:hypothetical protein
MQGVYIGGQEEEGGMKVYTLEDKRRREGWREVYCTVEDKRKREGWKKKEGGQWRTRGRERDEIRRKVVSGGQEEEGGMKAEGTCKGEGMGGEEGISGIDKETGIVRD